MMGVRKISIPFMVSWWGELFPSYKHFSPHHETMKGIEIFRTPIITRGKNKSFFRLSLNYISFVISTSFSLFRLRKKRIDVILIYGTSPPIQAIPGLILKFFKKCPVFFYIQDLWPESISAVKASNSRFLLGIMEKIVSVIYKKSDFLLVQSMGFIDSIQRFNLPAKKILYLPNTAEDFYQPYTPAEAPEQKKIIPEGFIVMFAGNIGIAQDFPTILAAAEKLRDHKEIYFVILGDGSMKSWLETEIQSRNLSSVLLLGRHPATEMPKFFAHANAMLVTLKDEEIFNLTLPAKVQSYLACAKPIVGAVGQVGAQVIKAAQAGYAAAPGQAEELANIIKKMYALPATEQEQMGANARVFFETHFKREVLLNRLESWLHDSIR